MINPSQCTLKNGIQMEYKRNTTGFAMICSRISILVAPTLFPRDTTLDTTEYKLGLWIMKIDNFCILFSDLFRKISSILGFERRFIMSVVAQKCQMEIFLYKIPLTNYLFHNSDSAWYDNDNWHLLGQPKKRRLCTQC